MNNTRQLWPNIQTQQTPQNQMAIKLGREYNQYLIDHLKMLTRRQIKSKDIVDLRTIIKTSKSDPCAMPSPNIEPEDLAYIEQEYYYCYIPCFEEGVYQINADRYIHWRIEDLSLERHRMILWLQDFSYDPYCGWQPGLYGDVAWRFRDPDSERSKNISSPAGMLCEYAAIPETAVTRRELMSLIDPKILNWNKAEQKAWKDIMTQHANSIKRPDGGHELNTIAYLFTTYTLKANRVLFQHKQAMASRPASETEHQAFLERKAIAKQAGIKPEPERRIRTIGPIVIKSKTKPKPGRRIAANYKKAAWETRAHFRTLKSGKKVYVRKSIHRRKALQTPDNASVTPDAATPVTLRLLPQDNKKDGEN